MGIQISLPMMAFLVLMTGFAGFVDSAAGGGGLISLPAYLFAGLPPHYTYATNKFSAACGTTFATASFFRNGAMNVKVGVLAAVGSFVGSALGAHIVLMLSDEVLQAMMFIILPIAAVVILWRRNLPDENRDDGTIYLKKTLLALGIGLGIGLYAEPCQQLRQPLHLSEQRSGGLYGGHPLRHQRHRRQHHRLPLRPDQGRKVHPPHDARGVGAPAGQAGHGYAVNKTKKAAVQMHGSLFLWIFSR